MPSPPSGSIHRWAEDDYDVTDDPRAVDLDIVQSFLANDSYWAMGRSREEQARANELSTCFSVLHMPDREFVGFARVLSDDVGFGWVADVFILEPHRGRGVGVFLMRCVVESFQQKQMTAVIHNNDDNSRATLFGLGLRCGRDFLRGVQREHFFHGQLRLRCKG